MRALLKTILDTIFPFTDFLWILQKEEYETGRYLYWLRRFFFRRNFVVSEKLAYTTRAKLTLAFAVVLWVAALVATSCVVAGHLLFWLFAVAVLALATPLFVLAANVISLPFFAAAHARAHARAASRVAAHSPMTVIAIVGSYGKTTTKHLLYDMVRYHHRTQMVPGTINTTAGIAAWLAKDLAPATEVLILEMDAYHAGEVAKSCAIAPPDIVIVTNIGEQHLARFKTHEALRRALGEAVSHAKASARIVADEATMGKVAEFMGSRAKEVVDTTRLTYEGAELEASQLSGSNRENLARVLAVAKALNIPRAFVEDTVAHFTPPARRQQRAELYGYEAVDDSFNISLSTARAGLAEARRLAHERHKRLLVIAAGIPELGPEQEEGNKQLGEAIANAADHTIVLGTMFAPEIERGLGAAPHTRYARLEDFIKDRATFPPAEWVLLLEPALPDLYY